MPYRSTSQSSANLLSCCSVNCPLWLPLTMSLHVSGDDPVDLQRNSQLVVPDGQLDVRVDGRSAAAG
jgi:hypothetical protein